MGETEQLLKLLRDYYDAAKIGVAMEDLSLDQIQDHFRQLSKLMQRTEVFLNLEQEATNMV